MNPSDSRILLAWAVLAAVGKRGVLTADMEYGKDRIKTLSKRNKEIESSGLCRPVSKSPERAALGTSG